MGSGKEGQRGYKVEGRQRVQESEGKRKNTQSFKMNATLPADMLRHLSPSILYHLTYNYDPYKKT